MAGTASVFDPALSQMGVADLSVFGPVGFRDYLLEHGFPATSTADRISISHFDALPSVLKKANAMVLRLGAGAGGRTNFALVRVDDVRDFFLEVEPQSPRTFLSSARMRDLVGYTLLAPSEATLVNLAFASGLLAKALALDDEELLPAPARGVLRASFPFRPHSSLETTLEHVRGQIEIDALFVGRREGNDHLFVLEAKQSRAALANHKLLYPVMALADAVPADMSIVPVYLHVESGADGYLFTIAECSCADPREGTLSLDAIAVERLLTLNLPLLGASATPGLQNSSLPSR